MSMASCSSSSSSLSSFRWEYDVFLCFRGETRHNFTSHLYSALCKMQVKTFIDDLLDRGKDLAALLKVIERSAVVVIIFSENFAESEWCLDEVVKIVECMKTMGHIVLPVFYRVDPSIVRGTATGSFADAISKHEETAKNGEDELTLKKILKWKDALLIASSQAGWDSKVTRPDSKIIEEIVKDVLKKLNQRSPNFDSQILVGLGSRLSKIVNLLSIGSSETSVVGIWGMGGTGKTTIAKSIFKQLSEQFEECYFIENADDKLGKQGANHLVYETYSQILGENLEVETLCLEKHFMRSRLRYKKVFLVFDDVKDFRQLEDLLLGGTYDNFGLGSRIIVTCRDRLVLQNVNAKIYEVEELDASESLELFSLYAFKQIKPPEDSFDHAKLFVNHCQGNALALKVLGSSLYGRSKEDWDSALERIKKVPNGEIQNALRISYDGLDGEQKNVFLDIACFFRGMDRSYVMKILNGSYTSVHFVISSLIDKSLVTISDRKVEMHDLLHEMGQAIVCEGTRVEMRSRLRNAEDIFNGTETIEGIWLDKSYMEDVYLEADTFRRMNRLRLLVIDASNIAFPPSGLQFLSDELRYLDWNGFPSNSLASNFCAENLVVLCLPDSKIKRLWTGVQHLEKLKELHLQRSKYLSRLPNLSKAENLEIIDLTGCASLVEINSSIQCLGKLEILITKGCRNLRRLPSRIGSRCLKILDVSNCSKVKQCPEISGNLEQLCFHGTGIKELPQSLQEFSDLRWFDLTGCSNLSKFPNFPRNVEVLKLDETGIEEVPSSIMFLTRLTSLSMNGCKKLLRISDNISKLKSLGSLGLRDCTKLECFPEILEPMYLIKYLSLMNCRNLKTLPDSICNLKNLEYLSLEETAIDELPSSVIHLSRLKSLRLLNCKSLHSLPELPPSLHDLQARGSESLKSLSSSGTSNFNYLSFSDCFNLDQKELSKIMVDARLRIQSGDLRNEVRFAFPGSEMPEWFGEQSMGSSVSVKLPEHIRGVKGIAFCIVLAWEKPTSLHDFCYDNSVTVTCNILGDEGEFISCSTIASNECIHLEESNHVLLHYDPSRTLCRSLYCSEKVSFQFHPHGPYKVNQCGVLLVYEHYDDNSLETLRILSEIIDKL
ncbi:unnamed protein product [Dovyalis caffra]|uniref:ADP-ribosyl cyclase/cyclic ADP-ribose hydrolase n=1 Tax=Dovyalis caffra TaxID=77055 RepID=A0AAV1QPA7_9ROSI|nr:unnamed protein product [Dovyalis caffra]